MKQIAFVLILLIVASVAYSDCVGIGHATKWALVNSHTILVYYHNKPLAMIEFANYITLTEYSEVYILDGYICDWAEMRVDNRIVQIEKVTRL